MSKADDIRESIIDAARLRFSHYGYPKTTIAEIAADCNMSPGNIYRFFKGKIDIAVELARRETLKAVHMLEAILFCPYRNSRQRLEDLLFADFRYTYHLLENAPRELELAQVVMQQRPHFQLESVRRERRVIQRVIIEGVKAGEFQVDNIAHATTAIHSATLKYRYPQLFTNQTRAELERELASLLTLLVRGLLANPDKVTIVPTKIPAEMELPAIDDGAEPPIAPAPQPQAQ